MHSPENETHLPQKVRRARCWPAIGHRLAALLIPAVAACSLQSYPAQPQIPVPATAPAGDSLAPAEPAQPEGLVNAETDILLAAIAGLATHGLDPEDYGLSRLQALENRPAEQGQALRDAWLLAATHLSQGRLDPETLTPRAAATLTERALLDRIDDASGYGALAAALDGLAPRHPDYLALRAELSLARTALTLETEPARLAEYAAAIDTLRVNLERWRWLPREFGPRYVFANIPGQDVTAFENDLIVAQFSAIFGKTDRKTPVFSDEVEYIVFNPWWEVPDSIARKDKLPQFRRDPGAVARLGYKVLDKSGRTVDPGSIDWDMISARTFPYTLRQAPGPHNALGQVKIIFPNSHSVYLHDTPDQALFDAEQRLFSSGCVRVKAPLDLAGWLLRATPGWDRDRLDAAVASGVETRVDLAAPVPVHIVYFTAVTDRTCGRALYLTDVYRRDGAVLQALQAPLAP